MVKNNVSYSAGGTTCKAYLTFEDTPGKKPLVMVVHAFEGCNALAKHYADKIAALGYIGFAVDMYGEGKTANTLDGAMKYAMQLFNDRALVRQRMLDTLAYARSLPEVDTQKIAALGFCLGGLCCLDLARSGADVLGVASFHGALDAPEGLDQKNITAKILVMNGYEDPQIPPAKLAPFMQEMQSTDVQFVLYNHTKHAFTDPDASKIGSPEMGRVYNALTTKRAWATCENFLAELFDS